MSLTFDVDIAAEFLAQIVRGKHQRATGVFLFASVLGTIVGVALIVSRGRSSQHPLPLGTFLGLAGVIVLFIGQPLVDWYGRLLRA